MKVLTPAGQLGPRLPGNPTPLIKDPALTAPRIRAMAVDGSGVARTMFTVGEAATLRISTETGSQSVVRGKVSGSVTQDFGTLPADIPVTFTQEGTWKADILGWTAKPVQGAASLAVTVTRAPALALRAAIGCADSVRSFLRCASVGS